LVHDVYLVIVTRENGYLADNVLRYTETDLHAEFNANIYTIYL